MHTRPSLHIEFKARSLRRRAVLAAQGLALGLAAVHGNLVAEPRAARAADVCVTNGELRAEPDGRFLVETSSSRAVVRTGDDDYVGMVVEYLGPSREVTTLASGEVRQQIGIKLQAQDSCNVVYVMWPIGADRLVVSTKVNQGMSAHAQCGVKGYEVPKPLLDRAVAPLVAGQPRRLEATIEARVLTVRVDGAIVWRGDAGRRTAGLFGYPGMRSDNVRARFEWLVEPDTDEETRTRGKPRVNCQAVR